MSIRPPEEINGVLDAAGFAGCFGATVDSLPARCRDLIEREDFSYQLMQGVDRDRTILEVLRRIESDTQKIGADDRKDVWERGWREILDGYVSSNFAPEKLVPKFIRASQAVRLNQQFVLPRNASFELRFVEVMREWVFHEFFSQFEEIHEFGCGTGFNLITLASLYPEKRLFGSDFVPASVEIANQIAAHLKIRLSARLFDMVSPPSDYQLARGSAVFTFGSLEQLASKFDRFLAFLLDRRPGLCLHVEPTV